MNLHAVEIDDFRVLLDPNNNFWAICDGEVPEEILRTYRELKSELDAKMERYRLEVDFNTVYVNITEK